MPASTNREAVTRIRKAFCDAGQGHVFNWWDDLTAGERENLLRHLTSIDLEFMRRQAEEHLNPEQTETGMKLEPAPVIPLPTSPEELEKRDEARKRGEELIRNGMAAVFVVAGGQGSRLGFAGPKGKFPITPVTGRSLFQVHSEKILALSRKAGRSVPFFIMTSETNHDETVAFFEENDFFGLEPDDVFFLIQGQLPAIDFSGKFILADRGHLFMSPDGHGGSLRTIYVRGALEEMEKRGIKHLFYFQVDNPLVQILDPVFLGYHDIEGSEMSSKIVEKRSPDEKVGVLGLINGKPGVIEYSDLDEEEMKARDEKGKLKFSAGSIAIHIINTAFIRRLNEGSFTLQFHKAEKKIAYLDDETGEIVTPEENNGIKFEAFVFDALRFAGKTMALEVRREDDFAPVKNKDGDDSPETARQAISALFRSWLEDAGFKMSARDSSNVEISPLFACDKEEFVRKVKEEGLLFSSSLFIQ